MQSTFVGRVPAYSRPSAPRRNDHRSIHPERDHRGSSYRRRALDSGRIGAPREMIVPPLVARIEERNRLSGDGIDHLHTIRLELVAWPAGEANVLERGQSTLREWREVIERQRDPAVGLAGQAVATAAPIGLFDPRTKLLREVCRHGAASRIREKLSGDRASAGARRRGPCGARRDRARDAGVPARRAPAR